MKKEVNMFVVAVTVWVKEGFVEKFKEATGENARCSRGEEGNVRFDVSQAEGEGGRFLLYEVYRTREDFLAHQRTGHYLKWKDAVAEWMAQPRQGVKHVSVVYEV